jgi:hypothetical protein
MELSVKTVAVGRHVKHKTKLNLQTQIILIYFDFINLISGFLTFRFGGATLTL